MNLEDESYFLNLISKDNIKKEKILKKLDSITAKSLSIIDINKKYISLSSNNILEKILNECINYNEYLLLYENKEVNNDIVKLYKEITGISISKTNELYLKIRFDFLCSENIEYYILLSFNNNVYNLIYINPEEIIRFCVN